MTTTHSPNGKLFKMIDVAATVILLAGCIVIFVQAKKSQLNPADYTFSSKKVVSVGVPKHSHL